MLKQLLLILTLTSLPACTLFAEVQEGVYDFEPVKLVGKDRDDVERQKRELLGLEDISVGSGAIASWGRKIGANVEARYADGTIVYRGKILSYVGFIGSVWMQNADPLLLPIVQKGVYLGLNGMAIGGKRKIVIDPSLVCTHLGEQANPKATCELNRGTYVRKEQLVVEATLTESCIPQVVVMPSIASGGRAKEVGCRRSDSPQRQPNDPIWKLY
ncbi:MAG: hypothetical protein OEY28_02130 [Nitrospira sp.]|nr:hypothetical protein [Nitrospira sp.]